MQADRGFLILNENAFGPAESPDKRGNDELAFRVLQYMRPGSAKDICLDINKVRPLAQWIGPQRFCF